MASYYYNFGIELEMIVVPHNERDSWNYRGSEKKQKEYFIGYYERLARAMRNRGLEAKARVSETMYAPRGWGGWFITSDASLENEDQSRPIPPQVPLEAVSGILATNQQWEREITLFWDAQKAVFHEPARSTACGTHIHITPGTWSKRWSLSQLRTIAVGIVRYDDLVQEMLPANRRTVRSLENPMTTIQPTTSTGLRKTKHYCRSNTSSSESLNELFNSQGSPFSSPLFSDQKDSMFSLPKIRSEKVNEVQRIVSRSDERGIIAYMQGEDRYALWNFHNIKEAGTGTIEFRGGRGVRGLVRTKWWISFIVGFIDMLLTETDYVSAEATVDNIKLLYSRIKMRAVCCRAPYLPDDYRMLNETRSARNNTNTNHQVPVSNQSSSYQTSTYMAPTQARTYQAPTYQAPTYGEPFNLSGLRSALDPSPYEQSGSASYLDSPTNSNPFGAPCLKCLDNDPPHVCDDAWS